MASISSSNQPSSFPLSGSTYQILSRQLSGMGISPNVVKPYLGAGSLRPFNISDVGGKENNNDNLKEILQAIKKTIPDIEKEYEKESRRKDNGFRLIMGITIFAVFCIAAALAMDILEITILSKGITAINAIVSLPGGIGLSAYLFHTSDKIEKLRRDLIFLYQIESLKK